jgi:basic amino acid/polyamine antiporter, APA family
LNNNPDAQLVRALGVRQLAANIFNYVVGSGIFALPALAVAHMGTAAPIAWVTCAVLMGLVVLCFAEAGSRVSRTGGPYAYVEAGLGPFIGFIAGALVFTTGFSAAAAIANLFARSALKLFDATAAFWPPLVVVITIATLVSLNMRGLKVSARLLEGVTLLKLTPLVLFILIGLAFVHPSNWAMTDTPGVSTILATSGVVVFAFSGIEGAMLPSGEVRNPSRTVPRAILLALGAATVLYLAIQYVAMGILGPALAFDHTTPLATAAAVAGPAARFVMIAAATVSMAGYLSANVLSEPRTLFAFARDGYLPRILATVHPAFRTPHVAIGFYGVMLVGLSLSNTYEGLLVFANMAALLLYTLCAISSAVLKRKDVRTDGEPFVVPGGPILAILTCAAIALVFFETVTQREVITLAVVLAAVVVLYGVGQLVRRRAANASV